VTGLTEKAMNDPYAKYLGIGIEKIEKGYSLCSIVIRENMLNFLGLVHGGLILSLADVAFSVASNCDYSPSYALDISGSFLRTAKVGDTVTAEAKLVHTTRRTGLYRIDISNKKGLVATFNGTVFRKVP